MQDETKKQTLSKKSLSLLGDYYSKIEIKSINQNQIHMHM